MKKTLLQLIDLLNDCEYHDGESLGLTLHITRSAVWKIVKKLQAYGLSIESMKGKGYRLLEPFIYLDAATIKEKLNTPVEIVIFESIDSTNQYLKKIKHHSTPTICLAEQQTKGRGRFNRVWHSPFGKNIYFSCLYPFQKDVSELAGLSLVVSLAVVKSLKNFGVSEGLMVKWSNDVLHSGQKLAGNLIELQAEAHTNCAAIIGIGLNVNMIVEDWTSVKMIVGRNINRNDLCAELANNLFSYIELFSQHGFSYFMSEWDQLDCLKNKEITLQLLNERIFGKVKGVNQQGYLLLELKDGSVRLCSSGEASFHDRPL